MTDRLPVHLNREEVHSVDVPAGFEAEGGFEVAVHNHGGSTHVHLHLDDALSSFASIAATNHHLDAGATRTVSVDVPEGVTGSGQLKVVTGFGDQTRYVDVTVVEPTEDEAGVAVDEALASPPPESTVQPTADDEPGEDSLGPGPAVPLLLALVGVLGTVAIFVVREPLLLAAVVLVLLLAMGLAAVLAFR